MRCYCKLLILLVILSSCAQTKPLRDSQEWVLQPVDPEINLTIDDQFLEKSRSLNAADDDDKQVKKTFLHP